MSAFQIHNTDDFITLESTNQAISIIGFSITKVEDGVLTELSRRILTFIDSFGYSNVIQMSETSLRLLIIISAPNVGDVISKSSILLNRMQKIEPVSPYLIISPINHNGIAENLRINYLSPLKKTSEPRIIKIQEKYWVFASLMLEDQGHSSISRYLQDLLTFQHCDLNLSTRVFNKNKSKHKSFHKGILISYHSTSFEESVEYLKHLQTISLQYKERFSLTIRFHSLNEIKRNKILFLLGLPSKTQKTIPWNNFLKIEKFIPNIRARAKKEIQKRVYTSKEHIDVKERNKGIFHAIMQIFRFPIFFRKTSTVNKVSNPTLETARAKKQQESTVSKEDSKIHTPIFGYGKEVSNEEMDKLINKIPAPPSS